jgi:maltose O-acetyltransferase
MIKKILKVLHNIILLFSYSTEELIKIHGGQIEEGVFIGKDVLIDYDYCFLLEIGKGAVISARTLIELHDSSLPNVLGKGKSKIGKIKIGSRAYIGVNSVILPGVTIGNGSIVGACSLVNRDIPKNQVWSGIPVKFICSVSELIEKRKKSKKSNIKSFDWIGEPEKLMCNYPAYKKEFLEQVKLKFLKNDN